MMGEVSSDFGTGENCLQNNLSKTSNAYKGFQTCFLNARSFNEGKRDYFNYILKSLKIDIICVAETWFHEEVNSAALNLDNYNLVRNDRKTDTRGGGVAIYIRNCLQFKIIFKSDSSERVEYLFVEIFDKQQKCLIVCIYNPSRGNDLSHFFNKFSEVSVQYEHILVCGDLNIDLTQVDGRSNMLCNNISSVGMNLVNHHPTRFSPPSKPSLLDILCLANLDNLIHFEQFPLAGISDHDMLFCSYSIDFNKVPENIAVSFRDFKHVDKDILDAEAESLPWNGCWFYADIDQKVEFLNNLVKYLFDKYVPLKTVQLQKNRQPWFNDEVVQSIKLRGKMHNRWRRNPTEHNWNEYRRARNSANSIIKEAKCRFYQSKLDSKLSAKDLWKNLKSVGVGKQKNQNCSIDANIMNRYFTSSLNNFTRSSSFEINERLVFNHGRRFNFSMCTECDVSECINAIKSDAIGEDGISLKFLKMIKKHILGPITHILNFSLTTRKFPKLWKVANVMPVAKKHNPSAPEHYRPISILSAISKIFEKFLARQIINHLQRHKLLTENQSGFRKNHSCTTAMLKIIEDIREKYDNDEITILVLLDFSKAFDSLDFDLILLKLDKYFGFDQFALDLMRSYLTERCQRVKIKTNSSSLEPINSGVPQGSILGPILFVMFINDIVYCCRDVKIHLYADDSQVYLSRPLGLVEDLVVRINEDLVRISEWANNNNLILNAAKTKALPISHCSLNLENVPDIILGNTLIKYEKCVTSLGFKLNCKLDCKDHVNFVVSKIYATLRTLWTTAAFTPEATKLKVVRTLIIPLLTYGAQVYGSPDSASKQKLQLATNNAARFIYNLRKFDHISAYTKKILNCDIFTYFKKLNLLFLFKLLHSQVPDYLYKKLIFAQSSRTHNLVIPRYRYLSSSRTFFVSAVRLWNSLPNPTKQISLFGLFRLDVEKFLK